MKPYLICPTCGTDDIMKNSTTHRGKQNYRYRDCGRQFVEYRQCATLFTDHWETYSTVPLSKHLFPVGKKTGLTSYIECFNNTLRQRLSKLVRRRLSFSKKHSHHEGAIWNFIHHYNAQIQSS